MSTSSSRSWLRGYSKILPFAVLFLIFMGALVTSNGAGLAVPDWPTTYGENMFLYPPSKWVGGIFYEHVHRLVASAIGLLTVILVAWILWVEERRWVRVLSICSLVAVIAQGVLGGLTVLFLLPPAVSVCHAVLAQTFLVMTIVIAYSQSRELAVEEIRGDRRVFRAAIFCTALVYLQLIIGAVMRHTQAGLAVPDFPTMGGSWLPALGDELLSTLSSMRAEMGLGGVTLGQVIVHLLHRAWAILVLAGIAALVFVAIRRDVDVRIRRIIPPVATIVGIQLVLGIFTVLSRKGPIITSLHVMMGAALLAVCVLIALRAYPRAAR